MVASDGGIADMMLAGYDIRGIGIGCRPDRHLDDTLL